MSILIEDFKSKQTPIEILLEVDENVMTTAKRLYAFLGLHPAHFAKWCKTNILGNAYANESIDYWRLTLEGETPTGGSVTRKDYKLTASFAKKLAMSTNNERGEQAKEYFIKIEDAMKQVAEVVKSDNLSNMNNLAFMKAVVAELETQKNDITIISKRASVLEERVKGDISALDERVTKIEKQKETQRRTTTVVQNTAKSTIYTRNNVYSPSQIAKAFGFGGATLNRFLAEEGIIKSALVYSENTKRFAPQWVVTEKYRNLKYSAQQYIGVTGPGSTKPVEVTYGWTPKGVGFIVNLLKYKGYTQHENISNKTKARTRKDVLVE